MLVLCMLQRRKNSKSDIQSEASQDTDIDLVKKTIDMEGLYTVVYPYLKDLQDFTTSFSCRLMSKVMLQL